MVSLTKRVAKVSNKINWVDKRAKNNVWLTPESILSLVREVGPIKLDPCTEQNNPIEAEFYYDESMNGLEQSWDKNGLVFVNPPYSKTPGMTGPPPIRLWSAKIHEEADKGISIIALLPCGARFSTKYWQAHILIDKLNAVCFIKGRVKFINGKTGIVGKQNNYDSMLYGFNIDITKFCRVFSKIGKVFKTEYGNQ